MNETGVHPAATPAVRASDATANIDRAIPQASWWGRRRAAYWRRTAAANAAEAAAATPGSSQCMTGV